MPGHLSHLPGCPNCSSSPPQKQVCPPVLDSAGQKKAFVLQADSTERVATAQVKQKPAETCYL